MVANANLALAIALPVGIVALLAALIFAAWLAGRRRRDRTDPLEASAAAAAVYPATHHSLYGKSTSGSTATTTTATITSNNTADVSDAASGEDNVTSPAKSSRNPFRDISLTHSRSTKRTNHPDESLWHVELDEVLDDRDWAPLEAGWREPRLQRQQQQRQHAQMRRAQSNGGFAARPYQDGKGGDMPGTSSRMSSSERMVFGLPPGQAPPNSYVPPAHRPYPGRNSHTPPGMNAGSATGHNGRSGIRPPPNVNANASSRGPGSVHGGASSSTLRSLRTVPEVPIARINGSTRAIHNPEDTIPIPVDDGLSKSREIEESRATPAAVAMATSTEALGESEIIQKSIIDPLKASETEASPHNEQGTL